MNKWRQFCIGMPEFKGKDISHNINLGFGDYTQISEYASDAVAWAVKNGIMKGNQTEILLRRMAQPVQKWQQ